MRTISSFVSLVGVALLGLGGCETYEFPPRLRGVGTDNCPACEVFVFEESRLPLGGVTTMSSKFAFEDERGALTAVRVFVTRPSGSVVEEAYTVFVERTIQVPVATEGADTDGGDTDGATMPATVVVEETRMRPGFTCEFRADSLATPAATCDLLSERESSIGSVAELLDGIEQGTLSVNFGVELTEVGEWTVEVEAEAAGGARSNRLLRTFDVVEDVGGDEDSGG